MQKTGVSWSFALNPARSACEFGEFSAFTFKMTRGLQVLIRARVRRVEYSSLVCCFMLPSLSPFWQFLPHEESSIHLCLYVFAVCFCPHFLPSLRGFSSKLGMSPVNLHWDWGSWRWFQDCFRIPVSPLFSFSVSRTTWTWRMHDETACSRRC